MSRRWNEALSLPLLLAALGLIAAASPAAAGDADAFLGEWSMSTRLGDADMPATMTLSRNGAGQLEGIWVSGGREMVLEKIAIEGTRIRFDREIPGGSVLRFDGILEDGKIRGTWSGSFGEAMCTGEPGATAPGTDEIPNQHTRPIIERDGRRLLWAGENEDGEDEWFDMTRSTIDPHRFQFGIGKDTIPSIDDPEFVPADDPRLAGYGITRETPVLGVEIDGIARAYPVNVMDMHEVVNDEFGGKPFSVFW